MASWFIMPRMARRFSIHAIGPPQNRCANCLSNCDQTVLFVDLWARLTSNVCVTQGSMCAWVHVTALSMNLLLLFQFYRLRNGPLMQAKPASNLVVFVFHFGRFPVRRVSFAMIFSGQRIFAKQRLGWQVPRPNGNPGRSWLRCLTLPPLLRPKRSS